MTTTTQTTTAAAAARIRYLSFVLCFLCLLPLTVLSFFIPPQYPLRYNSYPNKQTSLRNARNNNVDNQSTTYSGGDGNNNFLSNGKYNVSLLLIDHYDSFTYNLYDMLAQLSTKPPVVISKDAIIPNNDPKTFFEQFDGIVLSPGPGTPQEQPILSHSAIKDNPHLPLLGVCLGHQLLAISYGANVDRAPVPIHGQDHWISQGQDSIIRNSTTTTTTTTTSTRTFYPSIFEDLPNSFRVVRYHSLCAYDLPKDDTLIVTAKSNDDVIQGLQHKSYPHYGVQFHPESIGTQCGMGLLENFIKVVQQRKDESTKLDATVNRIITETSRSSNEQPSKLTKFSINKSVKEQISENILETLYSATNSPVAPIVDATPSTKKSSATIKDPRFCVLIHRLPSQIASVKPLQVFEKYYAHQSHSVWLDSSSYPSRGELDILASPLRQEDIIEYRQNDNECDILTQLENELFGGPTNKQTYGPNKSFGWVSNNNQKQQTIDWINENDPKTYNDANEIPSFHYRGGYLGFLSYEVRHDTQRYLQQQEREAIEAVNAENNVGTPNREGRGNNGKSMPVAAFFLARQSMVYHHPTESWYLIGLSENDNDTDENLSWMKSVSDDFGKWMDEEMKNAKDDDFRKSCFDTVKASVEFIPNRSKKIYEKDIDACHEFIRMGESYELCLTNQLEARIPNSSLSSFELYKILRKGNPSPYSSYFRWNLPSGSSSSKPVATDLPSPSSLVICSSSPERFMSVTKQQPHPELSSYLQAEAKPIKGTCARVIPQDGVCRTDAEAREDERRARSLELSLKNRAENLMIVDLLRNDMSRVCQVGTVHVAKLMDIESFATVHQMVSTIRGTLSDSSTSIDLLRASFPGGSMTGAPKIRTMELLEELERNVDRGPYSGSLGYLSVNGCMDFNIIIRSAVLALSENEDAWNVSIGAGGAITALSDAEDEYDEMKLKARAVVAAVQEWASLSSNNLELPIGTANSTALTRS